MRMKPRLLTISPVLPADTGNGLAMRAGLFLDALVRDHEVYLLVITVSGRADVTILPPFVTARAHRVAVQSTIRADDSVGALFRSASRLAASRAATDEVVGHFFEHVRLKRTQSRDRSLASRGPATTYRQPAFGSVPVMSNWAGYALERFHASMRSCMSVEVHRSARTVTRFAGCVMCGSCS